jgi:Ni,Fe-hydrogenase I small subunit
VSWCIAAGHPCIGCTEPDFLDRFSPLFRKLSLEEEQQAYRRAR